MTIAPAESMASPAVRKTVKFWRRHLGLVLKCAVTAVTLFWVARSVSAKNLASLIVNADLKWLLPALGIFWFAQFVSAMRYVYIARTLGHPVQYLLSARLHFIGLWFNQVFPTGLGGDVVKILLLKPIMGAELAFRTTVLDRASGLIFLLVSVVVLLPLYFRIFPEALQAWGLGAFAVSALAGAALVGILAVHLIPVANRMPVAAEILRVFASLLAFRKRQPLWQQTWTSAIVHLNGILAFALVGKALGIDLPFMDYFLMAPLVFLVALIPVSLAGWGIRELGSVWLFGLVGLASEQATAISMLYGLMLIVAGLPGLVLLPSCKMQSHRLGASLRL